MYRREFAGHRASVYIERGSSSSGATGPGEGPLLLSVSTQALARRRFGAAAVTLPGSLTRTRTACVDFTSSSTK